MGWQPAQHLAPSGNENGTPHADSKANSARGAGISPTLFARLHRICILDGPPAGRSHSNRQGQAVWVSGRGKATEVLVAPQAAMSCCRLAIFLRMTPSAKRSGGFSPALP